MFLSMRKVYSYLGILVRLPWGNCADSREHSFCPTIVLAPAMVRVSRQTHMNRSSARCHKAFISCQFLCHGCSVAGDRERVQRFDVEFAGYSHRNTNWPTNGVYSHPCIRKKVQTHEMGRSDDESLQAVKDAFVQLCVDGFDRLGKRSDCVGPPLLLRAAFQ